MTDSRRARTRAANRLNPKLRDVAAAFYFWVEDCTADSVTAELAEHERRAGKMKMMLETRDKEIRRLKTELQLLQPQESMAGAYARNKREKQIRAMEKRQGKKSSA